jgi:hypothetical protein
MKVLITIAKRFFLFEMAGKSYRELAALAAGCFCLLSNEHEK